MASELMFFLLCERGVRWERRGKESGGDWEREREKMGEGESGYGERK